MQVSRVHNNRRGIRMSVLETKEFTRFAPKAGLEDRLFEASAEVVASHFDVDLAVACSRPLAPGTPTDCWP